VHSLSTFRLNGESDMGYWRSPFTNKPEPRYASLPNIMKAKKKPIEKLVPEDLEGQNHLVESSKKQAYYKISNTYQIEFISTGF